MRNLFFDDRQNGRLFNVNNSGLNIFTGALAFLAGANIYFSLTATNAERGDASILFDRTAKYLFSILMIQLYKYGTDMDRFQNRNSI